MRVHLTHPTMRVYCGCTVYKNQRTTDDLRDANCPHCLRIFDLHMSQDTHTDGESCDDQPK